MPTNLAIARHFSRNVIHNFIKNLHNDKQTLIYMINENLQNIATKIRPILIKLEFSIFMLMIAGYLLSNSGYGNILLIFSLGTLSILYYLIAFGIGVSNNEFATFLNKLTYMSLSIGIIGALFTINHYPFASVMMLIGLLSTILSFLGLIIIKIRNKKTNIYINSDIIRTFVFAILFALLMNFTNEIIIHGLNDDRNDENKELVK